MTNDAGRRTIGTGSGLCFAGAVLLGFIAFVQWSAISVEPSDVDWFFTWPAFALIAGIAASLCILGCVLLYRDRQAAREQQSQRSITWIAVYAVVAFIVFLVAGVFFGVGKGPETEGSTQTAAQPTDTDAWYMARQFLDKGLKAPSTAKYPKPSDPEVSVSQYSPGCWDVKGYVDAQNSFGAMLRDRFQCRVQHIGGEQWKLLYMQLGDKVLFQEQATTPPPSTAPVTQGKSDYEKKLDALQPGQCSTCFGIGTFKCKPCAGSGILGGNTCKFCEGTGKVKCTFCNGTGKR